MKTRHEFFQYFFGCTFLILELFLGNIISNWDGEFSADSVQQGDKPLLVR